MTDSNQIFFTDLRHRLLNDALLWLSITATPSVIISVTRVLVLHLSPWLAIVQTLILVTLWLSYFFRHHLAYHIRVLTLLGSLWIVMTLGLATLGPVANASIFTLLSAFISILFLRGKYAVWVISINLLTIILIATAASKHWLVFDVDYQVYAHNPLVWALIGWSLTANSIIFALIGLRMVHGLLNSESKFHQLYDTTSDAIFLFNNTELFDCNKAALNLFGFISKEALCAYPAAEHSPVNQDDGTNSITMFNEHIATTKQNGSHRFEWIYQRHDNKLQFAAEVLLNTISLNNTEFIQATVRDISERKHIEKIKSEFISTVSHELRTPLTSISGALSLINSGTLGDMPEQAKQMLGIAQKNSIRLALLINDLLDMDKLASGNIPFDMQLKALKPQLEQALEVIREYGVAQQIRFSLIAPNEPLIVKVDVLRLQQVLSNFLSNAIKFSPTGGLVEVKLVRKHDVIRVEVIDHGAGIQADFYPRIFQKFSQADSSDSRQKGGTGLGLSISKEIIKRMQGKVGFESEAGNGACFYFELPMQN